MYEYEKQTWNDGVAGGTPLNAERLNHMEEGIEALSNDLRYQVTSLDNSATIVAFTVGSFAAWTTGLGVVMPPTDKVIDFSWMVPWYCTTGGVGNVSVRLVETTTGAAVERGSSMAGGTFTNGVYDSLNTLVGFQPVEPLAVPAWRTFKLEAGVFRSSGSLAASAQASSRRAFLKAVA